MTYLSEKICLHSRTKLNIVTPSLISLIKFIGIVRFLDIPVYFTVFFCQKEKKKKSFVANLYKKGRAVAVMFPSLS